MQRGGIIIVIAVALVIAWVLVSYPLFVGISVYSSNNCFISTQAFGYPTLSQVSGLLMVAKINSQSHFFPKRNTQHKKTNHEANGSKLAVFKGREASLNRAIFAILAMEGPKTIIELQRQLSKQKGLHGTYYASINKRIHCLEKEGYVSPIQTSQPALKAVLYELRPKALLATFMSKKSPEEVLNQITDKDAIIISI